MKTSIALSILFLAVGGYARAGDIGWPEGQQLVVNHPPTQAGGPASDTEFLTMSGQPFWQQSADNFQLGAPALIDRICWHGFYDLDNPPASEAFRVRFHAARPNDGLPGDVLHEETFLSPSRVLTGQIIGTFNLPHEYFYSVELSTPVGLEASTTYWLEIVQVGDLSTFFRWEFATPTGLSYAFMNPNVTDWQVSTAVSDLAFQLWTIPEPLTAGLLLIGCLGILRRRRARRRSLPPSLG